MATIQQLYEHLKTLVKQYVYDKDEVDTLLDGKVDKVTGKELSDNNYTSEEKNKLAGIETEANKTLVDSTYITNSTNPVESQLIQSSISSLESSIATKASSADLHTVATSGSYLDLENIPETFAPSSHEHSASEVKDANAYSNLNTTANATQSAINFAIDSKIGALLNADMLVLETTLPTASAATMNKFYLVPEEDAETNDAYEIFITVETVEDDVSSYDWEKVDTARIDLTDYVKTNDARLSDARTPLSHVHGNISNDGKIGSDSGKLLVTGANGVITVSDDVSEMDATIQSLISYGVSLEEGGE